jgi:hypothetical protein
MDRGGGANTNFVRCYWVREVKYLDLSARGPDHEHLILHVHGVTSFLEFHSGQWSGRSEVPILDSDVFPSVSDHVLGKKERKKEKKNELSWVGKG